MTHIMTLFYRFLKTLEISQKTSIPQNLEVEKYNLKIRNILQISHNDKKP